MTWKLRQSTHDDASWLAELRATVMRPDLERVGRFDEVRVRQRLLSRFNPEQSFIIDVDGEPAGLIVVRPEADAQWIEHFLLDARHRGRGIGGQVLRHVMAEHGDDRPFKLKVLQGSAARRLYERHGFVLESEDPIDVSMIARADI